jgi:hypothetical protein
MSSEEVTFSFGGKTERMVVDITFTVAKVLEQMSEVVGQSLVQMKLAEMVLDEQESFADYYEPDVVYVVASFKVEESCAVDLDSFAPHQGSVAPEHGVVEPFPPGSDIFAFGVMCYHFLAGQNSFASTVDEVHHGTTQLPESVSHEVGALIDAMLDRMPNDVDDSQPRRLGDFQSTW